MTGAGQGKPVSAAGKTSTQKFAEADAKYADKMESMTMKERSLLGLPYIASEEVLKDARIRARNLLRAYNSCPSGPLTEGETGANDLTNVKRREILGQLFQAPTEVIKRVFIEPPFWW